MKPLFTLLCILSLFPFSSNAQSRIYSVPVIVENVYLEDSAHVVGRLDLDFPEDGQVFIQFDGYGFGDAFDRIVLAANNYPNWETNFGNTGITSYAPGEPHCFSHTRHYPVTAGQHSYYAIAHNFVDIEGNGFATVYGTLTVEYIPNSSGIRSQSSTVINQFNGNEVIAFDSVTIQATGPGTIEVRFSGNIGFDDEDIMVVGISDSRNWNYTDPTAIPLETNIWYSSTISTASHRLYNVDQAGSYTFYAMGRRGFEEEGDGLFWATGNLNARYYPEVNSNVVAGRQLNLNSFQLNSNLTLLDSIVVDADRPGKVEVRFDGALQSIFGDTILIATGHPDSSLTKHGSVILQTNDDDVDRHQVVHSQVFDVEPGEHTFYLMAQHMDALSSTNINLTGHFLVKYYPDGIISSNTTLNELSFQVWPNPATDHITIQSESEVKNVTIYNAQGQMMLHHTAPQIREINTYGLHPGTYFLRVMNAEESGIRTFVIQ